MLQNRHSTAQFNYILKEKNFIDLCCICGNKLIHKRAHKFLDLLGSDSHEYTQNIAICPECGLIITQNPFTPEQLEARYKNMSKYEYDSDKYILENNHAYIKQCYRQKNFIDENIFY